MCSVLAWAGAGGAVCGVGAGVCGGVGVRVPSCGSAAEVIVDIVKPTDRAITVFGALVAIFAEDCKEASRRSLCSRNGSNLRRAIHYGQVRVLLLSC